MARILPSGENGIMRTVWRYAEPWPAPCRAESLQPEIKRIIHQVEARGAPGGGEEIGGYLKAAGKVQKVRQMRRRRLRHISFRFAVDAQKPTHTIALLTVPLPSSFNAMSMYTRRKAGLNWTDINYRLNAEISAYYRFVSPTTAEFEVRLLTIEQISRVIKREWPKARVEPFGSWQTQLYLPHG